MAKKSTVDQVKNTVKTATSTEYVPGAAVEFLGETAKTVKGLGERFVEGVRGMRAPGTGGIVGRVGSAIGSTGRKANDVAVGVMKHPVGSKVLMVALAVGAYKAIKHTLGFGRKNEAVMTKEQELNQLRAENAQLQGNSNDYQFDNSRAQGGHVNRYQNQQNVGHSQGARTQ